MLIDGSPLLGDVPDALVLATASDHVLIVARLARTSTSDTIDLRERLDHIAVRPLGLAVVDDHARVSSPYEPEAGAGYARPHRERFGG